MIHLDGGFAEGGGQIVRTALALSTLTGKPFDVHSIRKGRCDSGLKPQHLKCIEALKELSGSRAEGAELGSEFLSFYPGTISSRSLVVDVGTAGSVTLLLQSLLLPAVFGPAKIRINLVGGTDVKWSEPYDYFKEVFMPNIAPFCEKIELSLERRGYHPKGGGKVELFIAPRMCAADFSSFDEFRRHLRDGIKPLNLDVKGDLLMVKGISHASKDLQKSEVAERQVAGARRHLAQIGCPVRIDCFYSDSLSTGSGICLWAVFAHGGDSRVSMGGDALGEREKKAEAVGVEAAINLMKELGSGAPVDHYLADQLLPFIALSGGRIKASKVSGHVMANIHVIEQFLGKSFDVDGQLIVAK